MKVERIKGIMAEKNITQRDLAKALGVSIATINAKLSRKTDVKVGEIEPLCSALGITSIADKVDIFLA